MYATYLFIECVTKLCDPPDWLIQICYQSASSRVNETAFSPGHGNCFQKCFSVENRISMSLNAVISIGVIV